MPGFEVWLPVGAVALYLFDSTLLLYSNELIFLHRPRTWSWARSSTLLLAGRRVYFPNPLTPGTPQFRVRWSEADSRQEQEDSAELDRFFRALRPVQYLVNTLLVILLVLPVELLLFGTGVELLVVMAAFYLVVLATLSYLYAQRHELRLTGRSFLALCFDSLACAPFAINLVRKLALRRGLAGNPIAFATRAFEPAAVGSLIHAVAARVSEEQQREAGQSARWADLEAYRQRLTAMLPAEPRDGPS
ncbi:MAG TPA: hypothetical protein VNO35_30665 [Steroidobacteraceae bacterium]|nr:hypothetical protein [Steroidobacteraceae bacterium]